MQTPKVTVKPKVLPAIKGGHPWIFSQAIAKADPQIQDGAIVDVFDPKNSFLARGYYNSHSDIRVRILTRDQSPIDEKFFEYKIRRALHLRELFIDHKKTNAYRVVFGESDFLPGLVVDRYSDFIVFQIHTLGIEKRREIIVNVLEKIFHPQGIYERSDVGVRKLEGLNDQPVGVVRGKEPPNEIEILENGVKLLVNVKLGQKTGLFLDQRENRLALQKYCKGKRVLNCFSYTGGFSVYAALAGAKSTTSIDLSSEALETAKRNFEINGLDPQAHEFIKKDVFDYLETLSTGGSRTAPATAPSFDLIILDPPAFAKNQKSLPRAIKGYTFINRKVLQILPQDGILITSSCSAHISDQEFRRMLFFAAQEAKADIQVLESKIQPVDHPLNIKFPEGQYLKFYVCVKR